MRPTPAVTSSAEANRQLLRGSAWSITLRWTVRLIGLVSTVVIARLLTPDDLGLFAMAMLVMGLIDQMSDLGVHTHLIRTPHATREHCDTAWTMMVLQNALVAIVVVFLAPLAAKFFDEPRVVPIMYVMSVTAFIGGFVNIGMTLVRRELDFAKDFRFDLYRRLIRFFCTLTLAFALRSYWALVIGGFMTAIGTIAISYRMHPYRPRFSLAVAREYLHFGAHVLPIRLARYLSMRIGVVTVGRIGSTSALGSFNVMFEIANVVVQEIVLPIGRALLPSYSRASGEPRMVADAFGQMFAIVCVVCLPLGAGLACVAEEAVLVVLGPQWRSGIPLLPWLAAFATIKGLAQVLNGPILLVANGERLQLLSAGLELALLLPAVAWAGATHGVIGVVVAMVCVELALLPIAAWLLTRALPISVAELIRASGRPMLATAAMVATLIGVAPSGADELHIRLLVEVAVGAAVYTATLLALWRIAGSPPGPERLMVETALGAIQRARARR